MAIDLDVHTGGLRAASADSSAVAAEVLTSDVGIVVLASRPSGAGVSAFDSVCSSVRLRHAGRVAGYADALSSAAAGYDAMDGGNADSLSTLL